jgi:hypothetical protein
MVNKKKHSKGRSKDTTKTILLIVPYKMTFKSKIKSHDWGRTWSANLTHNLKVVGSNLVSYNKLDGNGVKSHAKIDFYTQFWFNLVR